MRAGASLPGRCVAVACTVAALAVSSAFPARAQLFGRWWWTGTVVLGQTYDENKQEDRRLSVFDERNAGLWLNLHGFLGHPALGSFRLGLQSQYAEFDGINRESADRYGLDLDLDLMPRGAYSTSLFFRHRIFDYELPPEADPLVLLQEADSTTSWGAVLTVRKGWLDGTQVGANSTATDHVDPAADDSLSDSQFIQWGRTVGSSQHQVRLDRRRNDYGTLDWRVEDLTASLAQRGTIGSRWRWQVNGSGIRREFEGTDVTSLTENYRWRGLLQRPVRDRDLFEIRTDLGLTSFDSEADTASYSAISSYRWRAKGGWHLGPFVRYAVQNGDAIDSRAPGAGLSLTWRRDGSRIQTLWSARLGYGKLERETRVASTSESRLDLLLTGSVASGSAERLRKELEVDISRNELRISEDPVVELPDLGLLAVDGLVDTSRVRFTLRRSRGGRSLSGWAQWRRQRSSQGAAEREASSDGLSANVSATVSRLRLGGSFGRTDLRSLRDLDQKVEFVSVWAGIRLRRSLSLNVSFHGDRRDVLRAPDVEGRRTEVTAQYQLGQNILQARAFDYQQIVDGGPEITRRGVRWSLRRQFAGWLPIVTAPKRRGVIR